LSNIVPAKTIEALSTATWIVARFDLAPIIGGMIQPTAKNVTIVNFNASSTLGVIAAS